MTYWKDVPAGVQERLQEIAEVLEEARAVRHTFDHLGNVAQDSPAAAEIRWAQRTFDDDSIAQRVHRLVQLWTVLAAEMLAGVAALARQGEAIYSPLPLVRSAVEYSARVVWILDNKIRPDKRFARVLLDELLSAEEMCKAASHLGGKGSDPHQLARQELRDLRENQVPRFFPDGITSGSPKQFSVAQSSHQLVQCGSRRKSNVIDGRVDMPCEFGSDNLIDSGWHWGIKRARQFLVHECFPPLP